MIARITGTLIELNTDTNTILLEVGQVGYELMVPGYAISDLSAHHNRTITLYCLQYYEASGIGGNMTPRLIGFPQKQDKAFFQRFISVKGIGAKKALRALSRPLADIAYSIESGDEKMLSSLPEIGKRSAQQIIAELSGKLGDFAAAATGRAAKATRTLNDVEQEAMEILLQLGERSTEAEELIGRATEKLGRIDSTDQLVQAVYKMKLGSM